MVTQIIILILISINTIESDLDIEAMVEKVNFVREEGCKCGGTKMPPVGKVNWNVILEQSAKSHANEMAKHNYFSHFSKKGEDVGQRVEHFNYNWLVVGENIAEGQEDFDQVLKDWLKSPSHCKMIMDGKVDEMGIAKSGKYWVQHFGKQKKK